MAHGISAERLPISPVASVATVEPLRFRIVLDNASALVRRFRNGSSDTEVKRPMERGDEIGVRSFVPVASGNVSPLPNCVNSRHRNDLAIGGPMLQVEINGPAGAAGPFFVA